MAHRPDGWYLPRSDGPYPLPASHPEHRRAVALLAELQTAGGFQGLTPGRWGNFDLASRFSASVRRVGGYARQPQRRDYADHTRFAAETIQFYDRYLRALISVVLTYNLTVHHRRRVAAGLVPGQHLPVWAALAKPTVSATEPPRVLAEEPYDPYGGVLDLFEDGLVA